MFNHRAKAFGWVAGVLSIVVCQMTAVAQVDEVERLIYVAKSIKELVVEQFDMGGAGKSSKEKSFEVTAYDKDGKEVKVSAEQAKKLYKWTAKDSTGADVGKKGLIEQVESVNNKTRKVRNVLKMSMDKGKSAVEMEVRLADKFSTYSSAVGKSSVATSKSGAGLLKSSGKWIAKHPYVSTAGAIVVVGGGVAASGGGSSSSDGGSINDSNDSVGGATATAADDTVTGVSGTWHGSDGDPFTMTLSQNGTSISGSSSTPDGPGAISGSVTGNSITLHVDYTTCPGVSDVWTGTVNGNYMSGSWHSTEGDSGSWSASR
jgi:hypothetical protein